MTAAMQAVALTSGRPTLELLREVQAAAERRALEAYCELLETDTRRLSFPESSRWFAAVERAGKTVARMIAEREKAAAKAESQADAAAEQVMDSMTADAVASSPRPRAKSTSKPVEQATSADRSAEPAARTEPVAPHAPAGVAEPPSPEHLRAAELQAQMRADLDRLRELQNRSAAAKARKSAGAPGAA